MTDSYLRLYVHFVWTTWQREPFLTDEIQEAVYACLVNECVQLKCPVLAVGGIEDHVHILVCLNSQTTTANLAKQMKGVSSHLVNHQLKPHFTFRWQNGYGAISVSPNHLSRIEKYIHRQKSHHANQTLWPLLETSLEPPPS